jgi:uncharacterized protein YuzE
MKVIKTLALLGIIVFCASTLPIFLSPMDFSSIVDIDDVDENIYINLDSKDGIELEDPTSINLVIKTNSEQEIYFNPNKMLELEIYSNGREIEVGSVEYAFSKTTIEKNKPLNIIIDISNESLDLPYGDYRFNFKAISENNLGDNLEIDVSYKLKGSYYQGTNQNNDLTPVKLYFQTKNYDLIPVYRFVENQDQLHNIIEEEMLKGPINEGLISPIDKVNYIILRDTVIYVDLPRDSQVYTGEYSEIAYYAFVISFSQLSNSTRIRFTFDNLVEESWFNGINVRNSIPYPDNINAYIPVLGGDRFYLSEKNILFDEEATLQEQSFRIYEYIKNNSNGYFQSLQGIDINSAELFQDTLVIDFNKSLSSIYEYNEDLQDLLLDSFLYSFTSIQGVNSLRITINGEPIESFGTYDLSEPITPYQYYNLETINENPA